MELPSKPKGANRKAQYNLRIEPELLDWLRELGQEYERPVNYLVNHAIKQMKQEVENAKNTNHRQQKSPQSGKQGLS